MYVYKRRATWKKRRGLTVLAHALPFPPQRSSDIADLSLSVSLSVSLPAPFSVSLIDCLKSCAASFSPES